MPDPCFTGLPERTSMQLFVRDLQGSTTVVRLASDSTLDDLRGCTRHLGGARIRFLHCSRELKGEEQCLSALGLTGDATVHLAARLLGGKGGFGSNLRAAGKAKLTDNYDACRDLQGRRIRQQTAAKKLEEWQAQASERELETVALRHLKEVAKQEKSRQRVEVDAVAVLDEHRASLESVKVGLAAAVAAGKRAAVTPAAPAAPQRAKRGRIDALAALSDGSDSESEDPVTEDTSPQAAPSAEPSAPGSGASQASHLSDPSSNAGVSTENDGLHAAAVEGSAEPAEVAACPSGDGAGLAAGSAQAPREPLDVASYASAEELEALGADRLKEELGVRGLKVGGSLTQRAQRLFMLKSTSLADLPRSLFAKA